MADEMLAYVEYHPVKRLDSYEQIDRQLLVFFSWSFFLPHH